AACAEFEQRVVLDLLYPVPPETPFADPQAEETLRWFSERMRWAIWDFFGKLKIDPRRYVLRPATDDAESLGYCPRGGGQFVQAAGNCSTCGVAIQSFAKPAPDLTELIAPPGFASAPPPSPPSSPPSAVAKMPQPRGRSRRKR